ncbi:12016_t:CDS:2 [Funneliformis caledonium]|uniref:12016_t:CDS:1 n=1 Tax=Funneliformis caledonium TaxID=1117310 RepID=A0A9N9F668_9GLOM|nr:12016_t:CDS:2 [Funneliformis caledonium]
MPPWQKDNPSYNQEDFAKKFDISKLQVCNILKEKEKWTSIDISNKKVKNQKWNRDAKFSEFESALYL